jgi:hypothetical protein
MYIGAFTVLLLTALWFVSAGHQLNHRILVVQIAISVFFLAVAKVFAHIMTQTSNDTFTYRGHYIDKWRERSVVLFEGLFFIFLAWMVLRVFNHLTMTLGFPYADGVLIQMDQFIGLDWHAYFEFVANSPVLVFVLDHAYTGLTSLSILAFVGLVLTNHIERARFFFVTFSITAIVCTAIGAFFPAKAAVNQLLVNTDLLQNFPYEPGVYSVDIIDRLRSGGGQFFDLFDLPGLTTFPSFHTAAGIVMVYSYRGTRMIYPVSLYTAVMIASTPVYGGHYFVDIIAGTICALVICRGVEKTKAFAELFRPLAPKTEIGSELATR